MKALKKLFATVISLFFMITLATPAFADDTTYTITAPTNANHTYEVYQIFTGDLDGTTLSNVKWGANGTGTKGEAVANAVLDELEAVNVTGKTDTEQLAVITKYVDLGSEAVAKLSNGSSTKVASGYYLIKDVDNSLTDKTGEAYTLYLTKIVGNIIISPKTDVPTVEKKIGAEADNYTGDPNATDATATWKDANTASIGDTVNYKLTGTIPDMSDYDGYTYIFHDTLSSGLTYTANSVVVKLQDKDGNETVVESSNYYVDVDGQKITVSFENIKGYQEYKKINVYYQAVLNENCVVGTTGNPNTVNLEYNNNPNQTGNGKFKPDTHEPATVTGKTVDDTVITYTTEIVIDKIDGNDKKALTGAEFELTGTRVNKVIVTKNSFTEDNAGTYWKLKNGTYTETEPVTEGDQATADQYESTTTKYSISVSTEVQTKTTDVTVKAFVGQDGKVKFTGLADGTYTLKETTTPKGYNTIADQTVVIKSTVPETVAAATDTASWSYKWNNGEATNSNELTVENNRGSELPETGGIGTTIFYVVGGLMMVGAAVLLITKKRMEA